MAFRAFNRCVPTNQRKLGVALMIEDQVPPFPTLLAVTLRAIQRIDRLVGTGVTIRTGRERKSDESPLARFTRVIDMTLVALQSLVPPGKLESRLRVIKRDRIQSPKVRVGSAMVGVARATFTL